MIDRFTLERRRLLSAAAALALASAPGRSTGAARERTPSQSTGPFYPPDWAAGHGPDLLAGAPGRQAEGQHLALAGVVEDIGGRALVGARVEIWQADNRGVYRHPRAPGRGGGDPAFRGFGATVTDAKGRYAFRTIVPVVYGSRPPHIHVRIVWADAEPLVTQLYLENHPANERDGLLAFLGRGGRKRLMIAPASVDGGMAARFDFVL